MAAAVNHLSKIRCIRQGREYLRLVGGSRLEFQKVESPLSRQDLGFVVDVPGNTSTNADTISNARLVFVAQIDGSDEPLVLLGNKSKYPGLHLYFESVSESHPGRRRIVVRDLETSFLPKSSSSSSPSPRLNGSFTTVLARAGNHLELQPWDKSRESQLFDILIPNEHRQATTEQEAREQQVRAKVLEQEARAYKATQQAEREARADEEGLEKLARDEYQKAVGAAMAKGGNILSSIMPLQFYRERVNQAYEKVKRDRAEQQQQAAMERIVAAAEQRNYPANEKKEEMVFYRKDFAPFGVSTMHELEALKWRQVQHFVHEKTGFFFRSKVEMLAFLQKLI